MIQSGSTVKIHYTLRVEGEVIDTSSGRTPFSYVHGKGQIIPGLENQLGQLQSGDKKEVQIPPRDGYGEYDQEAVQEIPREAFANPELLQVGGVVQGERNGNVFQATIREVMENSVRLDFNHPLAGKTLVFDVEVLEILPPA